MKSYDFIELRDVATPEAIKEAADTLRLTHGAGALIHVRSYNGKIRVSAEADQGKVVQSYNWRKWINNNTAYGQIDTDDLVSYLRSQGIPVTL